MPNTEIKLIATDLDGTLLRNDHMTLSPANREALTRAAADLPAAGITPENARALLGRELRLAPTAIDRFYQCPYFFFCDKMLRLRPRQRVEFSPFESGSAIHYVFQQMVNRYGSDGLSTLTDDELDGGIRRYLREYIDRMIPNPDAVTARFRYQFDRLRLLLGCRKERDTPEFFAALYLLTSSKELADRTFNCFFRGGIDFRYARRRGISSHDYTLLMAAKSLYCHTAEVTQGDLAEPQIIPDEAFRLLINALLIARFGLDALKITARRGQREYTLRRLIRREAGGNAPSAGLLFPSEGR